MRLYHGTVSTGAENIIKNGIKLERGKPKVDFGQGFYTTTSLNFAKNTAMNKAKAGTHFHNINHKYDIVKGAIADNEMI